MALWWPMVAVLGFVAIAGLVIGLGRSSTARYEFERNLARGQQEAAVPAPAAGVARETGEAHGGADGEALAEARQRQRTAVGVATHPAGKRTGDQPAATAWWLVDESGDEPVPLVVAGPFPDRIEAEWAALAGGLADSARAVFGAQRADGALVSRQSPAERAWLAELGAQLERLSEDWDEVLTDTDALTTLVVEVGAALVEAGLPLHDCAEDGAAGGVCLTPDLVNQGVLIGWRQHDRMSVQQVRGATADAAVQQTMNAAVAGVLAELGFVVEPFGSAGCHLVTALRW
jgi:hypothetical protein